jgi:RNA ligase (TIGR02306 family)
MSTFEVLIVRIDRVEHHPNADRLSLIYFRDYAVISAKLEDGSHRYNKGDLVVYVPEGALVPEYLLRQGFWDEKNNRGFLAGSHYDRVKAIKLRGLLSQGIMYPVYHDEDGDDHIKGFNDAPSYIHEGDDVAEFLGIYKYEPPVPSHLSGEVVGIHGYITRFEIENYKRYPEVLENGEPVEFTEKLHGTWCGMTIIPGFFHPEIWMKDTLVYSKGLGSRGLVFKDNEANTHNLYLSTMKASGIRDILVDAFPNQQVSIFGEIYGRGVQDLTYGTKDKMYAAFDIYVGTASEGEYLNRADFEMFCNERGMPIVPILYQGGFSKYIMDLYTSGKTTLNNGPNIREGIVIRTMKEKTHPELGRVILKSVSDDYLLRKGNITEYN